MTDSNKGPEGRGAMVKGWIEETFGARWPSSPSPQCYQIWRMECGECDFYISPSEFRGYNEHRPDHPQPYGNLASISHARKLMREHVQAHKEKKS